MEIKTAFAFALASCVVAACPLTASAAYPEKPIRWIVPYNPGGGTDSTARILQRYIEEQKLLPQPIAPVNVGGAGGSIGARQVKDAQPDGYTILLHQSALLIQDANGMSDFGYRDFQPIISVGVQCMVAGVIADSPYKTYKEIMEAAKAKPRSVVWGGNIGSANHMAVAAMEHATPGSEFKKVQLGGAAESYAGLKGKVIELGNFGVGEILSFRAGGLRPLALLADKRDPAIPDVPTAKELGYDAVFCNEHNIYAPKNTPADRVAVLADAFRKALNSDWVKKEMAEKLGQIVIVREGKEFADHLAAEMAKMKPMADSMKAK